jgi:hypothetical protein
MPRITRRRVRPAAAAAKPTAPRATSPTPPQTRRARAGVGEHQPIRLGLHNESVKVGAHIAYFWETPAQFRDGVRFLEIGLDEGDFCVIFGHDEGNRRVSETLAARGHDCARLEEQRRLVVLGGNADATALLSDIGETFTTAVERGAKLIRLLGNIGWGKKGWPSEDDILEFEARVTGAAKAFPCVVVCMYDVQALSGRVMVHGAFETHPLTFCGNVIRQNTHYVEAEQFISELRLRQRKKA